VGRGRRNVPPVRLAAAKDLFAQITHLDRRHKYLEPERKAMVAMAALTDFNDDPATTHEAILERLQNARVSRAGSVAAHAVSA